MKHCPFFIDELPSSINLAAFTLNIMQWIKPVIASATTSAINFNVGWCHNMQELPSNTTGGFRFYGANTILKDRSKKDIMTQPLYLYFELIE